MADLVKVELDSDACAQRTESAWNEGAAVRVVPYNRQID